MLQKYIIHPFLIAIYSILALLATNYDQVPPTFLIRPLIVCICLAGVILFIIEIIVRDWGLAGFISFFFLTIGLNYSDFSVQIEKSNLAKISFVMIIICLAIIITTFILNRFIWNKLSEKFRITKLLNYASIFLLIFPSYLLLKSIITNARDSIVLEKFRPYQNINVRLSKKVVDPDIYYIIVDGYGRNDVLNEIYRFDNTPFLSHLQAKGFFVADRSHCNYIQTSLSISSSLNMSYLDNIAVLLGEKSTNRVPLRKIMRESIVIQSLLNIGYKFVAFNSGYIPTNFDNADIYLSPFSNLRINEFEGLLLYKSALSFILGKNPEIPVFGYQSQREITLFNLGELGKTSDLPGPKFVFVHVMLPHPPFIFNRHGQFVEHDKGFTLKDAGDFVGTQQEYVSGYTEQVLFLNSQLEKAIDAIISSSAHPPVIIIQGDHGPGALFRFVYSENTCFKERTSILNAYYLPGVSQEKLYPDITPVNTFRLIFNEYFDAHLDLLPDNVLYSEWEAPFKFIDITGNGSDAAVCVGQNHK